MSEKVKVPTVGESITEVTIATWLKKDGDQVAMDEVIAELESDKATFELPAPKAGILKIVKQEGETVPVGEVICEIDTDAASKTTTPKEEPKSKASKEESKPTPSASSGPKATGEVKEMKVPAVGESITEVTISTWLKKEGDFVALDEVIAEVESDKATFELPAEAQGILKIVAQEGTTLPIGGLICKIEVAEGTPEATTSKPTETAPSQSAPSGDKSYAAGHPSPAAGKILSEKGISPDQVSGTGVGGRITKEDAVNAQAGQQKAVAAAESAAPAPTPSGTREETREKMSSIRRTIARRLVTVKNETAMLTTFNEVDMSAIMNIRKKYKDTFKEIHGVGLGFMSFFTKACCFGLQKFPAVNAYIDGENILYHDYCDISIAVSGPKGLVVPVIRNAESLGMADIESAVVDLATKARNNKLTIEEMTGGTFTITNGGVFGSMMSTPIINIPQSAILGMHNIVERPIVVDGQIVIRPMMYVALSYDHRIIDGRESVSFLVTVKQLLENPALLLFGKDPVDTLLEL